MARSAPPNQRRRDHRHRRLGPSPCQPPLIVGADCWVLAVGNGRATADGRSLPVFVTETTVGDAMAATEAHSLGLRLIDPRSGEIAATALDDELIKLVMIVPDRIVYAYGPASHQMETMGSSSVIGFRLARVDQRTLDTEVAWEFPTDRRVELVPAMST